MAKKFDYQAARKEGYSDEEISSYLTEKHPKFDYQAAQKEGYSPQEINQYLSEYKPERSFSQKVGRIGTQFALGAAENALMPYEIGVAPLASKEAQQVPYRENLFADIERLQEQKAMGQWDENDQALYDELKAQAGNTERSEPFIQTADIGIRGLAEKATGLDLHPEGFWEHAASWRGLISHPERWLEKGSTLKNLAKLGIDKKNLTKTLLTPNLRAALAGGALTMAEEENMGPMGKIVLSVLGDVLGHAPGKAINIAKNPKQFIAESINLFTRGNSKNAWTKDLIEEARNQGIQLDAGTITNSNVIKWMQARAAQSGLSGEALDNFRKDLSGQVFKEYNDIIQHFGDLRFENATQAADSVKDYLKTEETFLNLPKGENKFARSLEGRVDVQQQPLYQQELLHRISPQEFTSDYQAGSTLKEAAADIKAPIQEQFNQRWGEFNNNLAQISDIQPTLATDLRTFVENHQGSMLLGESTAEARVLKATENLLKEIAPEGGLKEIALSDLLKTKRTLQDVANWEFGGSNFQSAYKNLVGEIDRAIDRSLQRMNPELGQAFEQLNAEYSMFKDTFENKNVISLFEPKNENYNAIYNSFITNPDKLRSLEDMLILSPRGEELVNQVKRDFAQRTTSKPEFTARDRRNLEQVMGEQFTPEIQRYAQERQFYQEHPLPQAVRREPITQRPGPLPKEGAQLKGRVTESELTARRNLYNFLSGKSSEQVMNMMNSVDGIRKLKQVIGKTKEGQKLFKELTRFKLSEMIDKKINNNITDQVKLGTFGGLLKATEDRAVIKELLGEENFNRLLKLQKTSGKLAESATKFLNASQSGTVAADVAIYAAGMTGVLTGNPFLIASAATSIIGMRTMAYLFSDNKFLKYLEEAVLTGNPQKFKALAKKMLPSIETAKEMAKASFMSSQG